MTLRKMISAVSEIQTKLKNLLCGQNVGCVEVKLVVHIVTTKLCRVKYIFVRAT